MTRSIATRLVALFAIATLATFALIGVVLYGVLERELMRHQDDELSTSLQSLQYSVEHVGTTERWPRLQARMDTLTPADGSVRYWVLCADPRFRYGKDAQAVERLVPGPNGHASLRLPGREHPLRTLSRDLPAFEDRPPVRIVIGIDASPFTQTLHRFLGALLLVSAGAVLLVVALGSWIARVGLAPLKRLSREAQALRPQTLSQRLPMNDLPVELSDLALAFNGALGRLETAYQQLEAFNADVAHELRTPLANLIGTTQVALSRQRSAEQFEEVLQSNLEELERLRSIINDMLFLARADQGEAATSLSQASVADEVRKTIDFFEFVLDETQVGVRIEGDTDARAAMETALFRRAMSNLLQNAIQHSPRGAQIVVEIARAASGRDVAVTVRNPGPPIDEAHLPRLFDRFYRVDAARHDDGQLHGHGLGLAIVKAVATMHGGSVHARSEGGLTGIGFSVRGVAAG